MLNSLAAVAAVTLCVAAASAGEEETQLPPSQPVPPKQVRAPSPLLGPALEPVVRLGQELYRAGVLPQLRYVQSLVANPVGGLFQGTDTSGVVICGADMDLAKLAGIPDVHIWSLDARSTSGSPDPRQGREQRTPSPNPCTTPVQVLNRMIRVAKSVSVRR